MPIDRTTDLAKVSTRDLCKVVDTAADPVVKGNARAELAMRTLSKLHSEALERRRRVDEDQANGRVLLKAAAEHPDPKVAGLLRRMARDAPVSVGKAAAAVDGSPPMAVYDADGNLVGICDPAAVRAVSSPGDLKVAGDG